MNSCARRKGKANGPITITIVFFSPFVGLYGRAWNQTFFVDHTTMQTFNGLLADTQKIKRNYSKMD